MTKFKVGDRVRWCASHVDFEDDDGKPVEFGVVDALDSGGDYMVLFDTFLEGPLFCFSSEVELVNNPSEYNPVSKPSHYNQDGGIECIDYIKQVLGKEGFVAYCRGNQIKYQHRAMYKGNAVQDLEKAGQYNAWAIETLKEIGDNND